MNARSPCFARCPSSALVAADAMPSPPSTRPTCRSRCPKPPKDQTLEPAREAPPESGPPRETPFPKIEHQDLRQRARSRRRAGAHIAARANPRAREERRGRRRRQHRARQPHRQDAEGRRRRPLLQQGSARQDRGPRRRSRHRSGPRQHGPLARRPQGALRRSDGPARHRHPRASLGRARIRQAEEAPSAKARRQGQVERHLGRDDAALARALSASHRPSPLRFVRRAPERARQDHARRSAATSTGRTSPPRTPRSSSAATSTSMPARKRSTARSAPGRAPKSRADVRRGDSARASQDLLADRPKSAQSDIYVGMLGPSRKDDRGPR